MKDTALEKRSTIKKRGQYALALFVVAGVLFFTGLPAFLLFFFGVLTFFIWKAFSPEAHGETKRIFDFYLAASEILRGDQRRWFGFEIMDAIAKGETLLREITAPPPLVYFALGALYQKAGDHAQAVRYLEAVAGISSSDEAAILYPSTELREYVRILRKIERSPAEAPQTSAAVRSLERLRRQRAAGMLDSSRAYIDTDAAQPAVLTEADAADPVVSLPYDFAAFAKSRVEKTGQDAGGERRTISEVLHDIYDGKAEG